MENKYIHGLDEYIRQGEPQEKERGRAWQTAIGLQEVDGLKTSPYLLETARRHIEGHITIGEAKQLIDSYYKSQTGRNEIEGERTEEADKVSARITELLQEQTLNFSPAQLTSIHRRLFEGIYKFAGLIRDYNITKREWVLRGETVYYASADTISETLDYDMGQERNYSYDGKSIDEAISHLTRFCANLWQIHAFGEGNTRSTAVFMIKYLKTLGFKVTNDLFATNSWYFRNERRAHLSCRRLRKSIPGISVTHWFVLTIAICKRVLQKRQSFLNVSSAICCLAKLHHSVIGKCI